MFYVYAYLFFITFCVLSIIAFDSKHQSDNEVMFYEDSEDWKNSNNYPQFDHDQDKPS